MSTFGTFDAFTSARLGIYAAQQGLKVTGNNVSNINTAGYTRQRLDQISLKTGGHDRYAPSFASIGNGTLVTGINQIRDPYLDIRYRSTTADVGYQQTMLEGLQEIASILDEVGKGGNSEETYGDGLLYAQLQDMAEKLRRFSADPTKDNNDLVRTSAEALTSLFRNYADRLDKLHRDTVDDFNKSVTKVNGILTNIQNLNRSIRECELNGDKALELRDERNRQIDALSEYVDIRVIYSEEDVGAGVKVEKLTILLEENNPDSKVYTDNSMLVDGLYATQLSVPEKKPQINPDFDPAKYDPKDPKTEIHQFMYLTQKEDPANPGQFITSGTNDPAEATLVDNDNYTIQLGKLLDTHGKEWIKTSSQWTDVSVKTPTNAKYEVQLNTNLADGDVFRIAGYDNKDFTVGDIANGADITAADAADPQKLAEFIVNQVKALPADKNAYAKLGYDLSAVDGKIVFTAKNKGEPGTKDPTGGTNDPPASAPTPSITNGGGKLSLGPVKCTDPGVKYEKPDDADMKDAVEGKIDPVTGTETTITYSQIGEKWYRIEMKTEHTREIALDDNDLHGKLQAQRELLTEEGEFSSKNDLTIDENSMIKRGIPYYQKSFDLLAQTLAEQYNKLNTGYMLDKDGNYIKEDGTPIELPGTDGVATVLNRYKPLTASQAENLVNNGFFLKDKDGNPIDEDGNLVPPEKKVADLNTWLDQNGGVKMGGPLFSNSNGGDDTSGITASNIDVSHKWSSGEVQLVPKFEVLYLDADGNKVENTTQNVNADHMVTLIDKALVYDPKHLAGSDSDGKLLFTGSFNDMFSNMMGIQAGDAQETKLQLNNSYTTQVELDSSRESVSGVDLNDEAMNMMQFQKAYSAACRLMTVIDEALDRLVNNTGAVGR